MRACLLICYCMALGQLCCSGGSVEKDTTWSTGREVKCKDLIPPVEPGTAISENLTHDPVLGRVCQDFMDAYYIEFAHLHWIDTSHASYFEQLQRLQDRHPTMSFTLVVHEDEAPATRRATELLRKRARLRSVRLVIDSDGSLAERFNVPWNCFAAFLIDSAATLRFWRCCGITIMVLVQHHLLPRPAW